MTTSELLQALASSEESAHAHLWDPHYNAPTRGAPSRLAKLLRPYGISSHDLRTADGVKKGYRRHDFHDAWERHLPAVPTPDSH